MKRFAAAAFATPLLVLTVACSNPKKQTVTVLQGYFSSVEALNKKTAPTFQKIDWAALDAIDPRMSKNHKDLVSPEQLRQVFRELETQTDEKAFPLQAQAQLQVIFKRLHPFTTEAGGLAALTGPQDPRTADLTAITNYHKEWETITNKAFEDIDAIVKKGSSFK